MAHSHDHTLLARLGFADPDRREPWHDVACQYLTQPDIMAKVAAMLPARAQTSELDCYGQNQYGESRSPENRTHESRLVEDVYDSAVGKLEVHVAKGQGFTVGFLDVVIETTYRQRFEGRRRPTAKRQAPSPPGAPSWQHTWEEVPWEPFESTAMAEGPCVAIEVKAHPATAGDVLRQIALYREHFRPQGLHHEYRPVTWLLATCYPITAREAEALTQAKILHVQLDPARIAAWAEQRDAEAYVAPTL